MYDNMTSFISNIMIGWHHVWQYDILYQQYNDRMTPCMTIWHPLPAIYWSDDTMYDNNPLSAIYWSDDTIVTAICWSDMTGHPLSAIYWSDDTMYDNVTSFIKYLIGWHHLWQYDILYRQYNRMTPCMTIDILYQQFSHSNFRMTPCMTIPLDQQYLIGWRMTLTSFISNIWSDDTMYDNMTSFTCNILIGWHHVWQ